jgi:hypothetical protein
MAPRHDRATSSGATVQPTFNVPVLFSLRCRLAADQAGSDGRRQQRPFEALKVLCCRS